MADEEAIKQAVKQALEDLGLKVIKSGEFFGMKQEKRMTITELMRHYEQTKSKAGGDWRDHILDELFHKGWISNETNIDGYNLKCIESYGGEGMGEEYWSVWQVTGPNGVGLGFVKLYGVYYSYDGATYQNWYVVKPVEKLVTVYE